MTVKTKLTAGPVLTLNRQFMLLVTLLLAVLLTAASCSTSSTGNSNSDARTTKDTEAAKIKVPPVEKKTLVLESSQVQVSSPVTSETGTTAVGSQIESRQVATSEARVEQILSEFNASKTDEGILITLPESILFDFDKADLKSEATATLQKMIELINHYRNAPVQIYGHTDSKGKDDYNQDLSNRRAKAVKDYLVKNGQLSDSRLQATGFGETKPIAPNARLDGSDDPEGRQKNRRVEVIIKNA